MAKVTRSNPDFLSKPTGYTQVVSVEKASKVLYVSGQVSKDRKGSLVGVGDLEAQTRQVYKNLKSILRSYRASFRNVVKLTIYTTQMENADEIRKARPEFFVDKDSPASTFVGVSALARPEFLVEIEAVVVLE